MSTVSQCGVVFFRNQDLKIEDQKILGQKLSELTGKPETSKPHRHVLSNSKRSVAVDENGTLDDEVSVISSEVYRSTHMPGATFRFNANDTQQNRTYYKDRFGSNTKRLASKGWHAEFVP